MLFNCCGVGRAVLSVCGRCCQARRASGRQAGRARWRLAAGRCLSLSPSSPSFHNHIFLVINFCLGSSRRCGHGHHHLVCLSRTSLDSPSMWWFPSPSLPPADSCRTAFVCRGRTCHVDDVTSLARVYTRDKIAGRLYARPSLKCPAQRCRLLPAAAAAARMLPLGYCAPPSPAPPHAGPSSSPMSWMEPKRRRTVTRRAVAMGRFVLLCNTVPKPVSR